jgi:hypothetical protein
MHFLHKAWKCAALFGDGQRVVEQVHQHRFAAPDAAP